MRVVIQDRREPALAFGDGPALAPRIVLDLIPLDLADAEIRALRMAKIEPAYRRAWPHCIAFGQFHADALAPEQSEQRALFRVVGLRRIARRRTDAAILFRDELVIAERLVRGVAPEFLAHTLMQSLGERFRQPIGQYLHHDRRVIVIGPFEALGHFVLADASRDGEATDVIGQPALTRRDEIAERPIGASFAF